MQKEYVVLIYVFSMMVNLFFAGGLLDYALYNIDGEWCWASKWHETPIYHEQEGYTNVTAKFISWFRWGVVINMLSIAVQAYAVYECQKGKPESDKICDEEEE